MRALFFCLIIYSQNLLAVTNSKPDTQHQFKSVVKILFNGGRNSCSGTLISETIILTASHCLISSGNQFRKDIKISLRNKEGEKSIIPAYDPKHSNIHPQYMDSLNDEDLNGIKASAYYDIAYLELIKPLDPKKFHFSKINLDSNWQKSATIVGFGLTQSPKSLCLDSITSRFCLYRNKKGHKTPDIAHYAQIEFNENETQRLNLYRSKQKNKYLIFKRSQGIWGDSGGPVFNSDHEIIAIIRGGDAQAKKVGMSRKNTIKYSYFLPLKNVFEFIQDI